MAGSSVRHRPNVLFNVIAVPLIAGGIGVTIYGIAYAVQIVRGFNYGQDTETVLGRPRDLVRAGPAVTQWASPPPSADRQRLYAPGLV